MRYALIILLFVGSMDYAEARCHSCKGHASLPGYWNEDAEYNCKMAAIGNAKDNCGDFDEIQSWDSWFIGEHSFMGSAYGHSISCGAIVTVCSTKR